MGESTPGYIPTNGIKIVVNPMLPEDTIVVSPDLYERMKESLKRNGQDGH